MCVPNHIKWAAGKKGAAGKNWAGWKEAMRRQRAPVPSPPARARVCQRGLLRLPAELLPLLRHRRCRPVGAARNWLDERYQQHNFYITHNPALICCQQARRGAGFSCALPQRHHRTSAGEHGKNARPSAPTHPGTLHPTPPSSNFTPLQTGPASCVALAPPHNSKASCFHPACTPAGRHIRRRTRAPTSQGPS